MEAEGNQKETEGTDPLSEEGLEQFWLDILNTKEGGDTLF